MSAQIRQATEVDAHGIAAVHVSSWRAAYPHVFPAEFLASLSVTERAARWRTVLRDGSEVIMVADDEALIVGFASTSATRDDDGDPSAGELCTFYVDPARWGRGIGEGLHAAALGNLASSGFHQATLWVLEDNDRARRFYERHDWATDGTVKLEELGGTRVVEVRYRRAIALE